MQVIRRQKRSARVFTWLLLALTAACQAPVPVSDNPYQRSTETQSAEPAQPSAPVQQLHNQAIAALNEDQYQLAADYLQRAIKIEPRNRWSWYYLADVRWRQGQSDLCRSMLDRADGYAQGDSQLDALSRELRERCR